MKVSPAAPGARVPVRPFSDTSVSAMVAGFVAMMTGYTSSLVLMFQAGQAAHLTGAQISSWIWALSIGMAVCTIGLSLRYRALVVVAWSTPGAALLVSSLPNVAYADAIGAFVICALLLTAVGLTGWFDTLMKRIPAGIASVLLAGILFDRHRDLPRRAVPDGARHRDVFHLSHRQAPRTALCDSGDARSRHRDGRLARSARLFALSCRARASGLHDAHVLAFGGDQHRHSAIGGRDGVAECAGHRRPARRRLHDALRPAHLDDRHRVAPARARSARTA